MPSVHDVAKYILSRRAPISTWKLQKLLYYSQAWHLVWVEQPLFPARIEAWANGPVVPEIYRFHRGDFNVKKWTQGDASKLDGPSKASIDVVLETYGELSGYQLSELTHSEAPWLKARDGLPATAYSSSEITLRSMFEFYSALAQDDTAVAVGEIDW